MASKVIATVLNLKDNFSETIKKTTQNINTFGKQIQQSESQATSMKDTVTDAFDKIGNSILHGIGLGAGLDIWGNIKDGATEMLTFGSDLQSSLNKMQVSTGATSASMSEFKDIMTGIYTDNFGESFEDIGNALSTVSQQTGATGDDLKGLTETALVMRDSFGMEVGESIRSVSTMMKQFGITGEEAFNLIAQGKQKGLDFSGEMLDSVNEYSVQFAKVGLNAEDMFNVFKTGTDSGAFNVDKIGDAVKEFSIRSIDGSKTSIDGFTRLGMSADDMASKFGKGGDTAKEAFKQTIEALKNMKDPVEQSIVGVDLFGTQFEDLGINAISALNNLDGGISNTTDALGAINSTIHYEDIGSAFESIKRSLQVGLISPISNDVMPVLSDFTIWFQTKIPVIKDTIYGVAQNFIGVDDAIKGIMTTGTETFNFINDNWSLITPVVVGITSAMVGWKVAIMAINTWTAIVTVTTSAWGTIELMIWGIANATTAWEAVQWLLNVAMDANPIGVVCLAIGALGIVIYEVVIHFQEICEWANKAWDGFKKFLGLDGSSVDVAVNTTTTNITDDAGNSIGRTNTPQNATGTQYWRGGKTTTSEHGDEIIDLPSGSKVYTASQSEKMLGGKGGDINIYFNGNVGSEEFFNQAGEFIVRKIKVGLLNQ